jgi:TPR repeat protein
MRSRPQPAADFNRALRCGSDIDAFAYTLRAAEEGCVRAQFLAGLAYHIGRGTGVDYERAAHWYRQAACAADSHAIANLGIMGLLHQGQTDDRDTYAWLQSAVGLGHAWLRPALDFLERRLADPAAIAGRGLPPISPETPVLRPCSLPGCDPSRCEASN